MSQIKTKPDQYPFIHSNKKLLAVLMTVSILVTAGIGILAINTHYQRIKGKDKEVEKPTTSTPQDQKKLTYATSCTDLKDRIIEVKSKYSPTFEGGFVEDDVALNSKIQERVGAPYFTETNTQVAGIDEADIVKTNGKELYTLNKNDRKINIIKVFPFSDAKKIGEINLKASFTNSSPTEMYITKEKLIVWGNASYSNTLNNKDSIAPTTSIPSLKIQIYNITTPEKPELERTLEVEGKYITTRLKGDYFYLVTQKSPQNIIYNPLPSYKDEPAVLSSNAQSRYINKCEEVGILPEEETSPSLNTVMALNINGEYNAPIFKTFLGNANTIYMNDDYIYLVGEKSNFRTEWDGIPLFSRSRRVAINNQNTYLTKLSYKNDSVDFLNSINFDGKLLNQFSLDEYNGDLRVVGTLQNNTSNFLKIFDKDLNEISNITNLAKGEKIYSARFYGDTGVMVTFKQIDPLFVFDLSDAKNPKLKGELKIPGYSDYLQFLDKTTVLGFGKDVAATPQSTFDPNQGLKLAIFDIKDMSNPKEISKITLGGSASNSEALKNHRAFIFDKKHNLILFPADIYNTNPLICKNETDQKRGNCGYTLRDRGAQVIKFDNNALTKVGEIKHFVPGYGPNRDQDAQTAVDRVIVVEDGIVTISENVIKIHDANDIQKQIVELRI
jgi:uncharacterized secreted protein with C-terminal beta-propeller domain